MKYLILSDIHGNLEALQSALLEVAYMKFDKYIILGDLVGYGANPNEVVKLVRKMDPIVAIRGNHDKVSAGLSDGSDFNYAAREAALWTRMELSPDNIDYVANLPQGPVEVDGLFDIVHGAPWNEDYYIFHWRQALAVFQHSDKRLTLFGHTHVPAIWVLGDRELRGETCLSATCLSAAIPDEYYDYKLEENKRYLVNPGSVGQPRDGNPGAGMAVFDTDEMRISFFRVEYNIKGAQEQIHRAGLDRYLADRLASGI